SPMANGTRDHRRQPSTPNNNQPDKSSGPTPEVRDHRGQPPQRPAPPHSEPGFGDTVRDHRTSAVKHVFVLMLENRSFDHMLGFSDISGTDAKTGKPTKTERLKGTESNRGTQGNFVVTTGAADVMGKGPSHNFVDVLEQLCGHGVNYPSHGAYPAIHNNGFVTNYEGTGGPANAGDAMKCFAPDKLPVLNALAHEFVVCDHWFSSMPGP